MHDEIGRFRVWLGNVGAHRLGRVSLDYRLRDALHMRESVLDLLKDLDDNIHEGSSHSFWSLHHFEYIANELQSFHEGADDVFKSTLISLSNSEAL